MSGVRLEQKGKDLMARKLDFMAPGNGPSCQDKAVYFHFGSPSYYFKLFGILNAQGKHNLHNYAYGSNEINAKYEKISYA